MTPTVEIYFLYLIRLISKVSSVYVKNIHANETRKYLYVSSLVGTIFSFLDTIYVIPPYFGDRYKPIDTFDTELMA